MSRPWLLLDRDDTILDDPGYMSRPDQVKFLEGALAGLKAFWQAEWPLVVLTNQSGLGRGYFQLSDLQAVHERFEALLAESGVTLHGIYFCPHSPDDDCPCRKPKTLLAERAAQELGLSLSECVMVGDKESDLELGRRFGARYTAQIISRNQPKLEADGHFKDLLQLAQEMLSPK